MALNWQLTATGVGFQNLSCFCHGKVAGNSKPDCL